MSEPKKKILDALENIRSVSAEVRRWPKWKLNNTLLAFSEYQRKKDNEANVRPTQDNEDIQIPPHK